MRSKSNFKTVVIGFAVLIVSTLLWVGWKNYDRSTNYIKTVGSCNQPTTIKIYDETGGVDPAGIMNYDQWGGYTYTSRPVNTIENKHFKNYVTTISKYVFAKVDAMGLCQADSGQPQVDLVFVYRPAISRGITSFVFQPPKSPDTKRLDSPWVKLALHNSPKLNVRAVFIWNERQFLLDQALKFGAHFSDTKPLLPIDLETFDRWQGIQNYANSSERLNSSKQLPTDIRWLFVMDRRGKSLAQSSMGNNLELPITDLQDMREQEKIGYIELNKALIARVLASIKPEIHYSSLLDLKDVFDIDKYRIYPHTDVREIKYLKSLFQKSVGFKSIFGDV